MRILMTAAAAMVALPAMAATQITITPRAAGDPLAVPACTGTNGGLVDRICVNGDFFGANFGSIAEVAVLHDAGPGGGSTALRFQDAFFGTYAPGFYRTSSGGAATMTLTPIDGIEIAFISFDVRRGTATSLGTQNFSLTDGDDNLLWSLQTGSLPGTFTTFDVDSAFVAGPLIFSYQRSSGVQVMSNIVFAWRPVDEGGGEPGIPGVIPEPATWAMMIAGFGLVGGAMRRRRNLLLTMN
jgi:hypothetical protein